MGRQVAQPPSQDAYRVPVYGAHTAINKGPSIQAWPFVLLGREPHPVMGSDSSSSSPLLPPRTNPYITLEFIRYGDSSLLVMLENISWEDERCVRYL